MCSLSHSSLRPERISFGSASDAFELRPRRCLRCCGSRTAASSSGIWRVLSASELYCADDEIVFHDWGTGDVSALNPGTGAVVYRGHDPLNKTPVAGSLEEWFEAVYQEIKSLGYLSHPDDGRFAGEILDVLSAPALIRERRSPAVGPGGMLTKAL